MRAACGCLVDDQVAQGTCRPPTAAPLRIDPYVGGYAPLAVERRRRQGGTAPGAPRGAPSERASVERRVGRADTKPPAPVGLELEREDARGVGAAASVLEDIDDEVGADVAGVESQALRRVGEVVDRILRSIQLSKDPGSRRWSAKLGALVCVIDPLPKPDVPVPPVRGRSLPPLIRCRRPIRRPASRGPFRRSARRLCRRTAPPPPKPRTAGCSRRRVSRGPQRLD
jgi:hypothetical protein